MDGSPPRRLVLELDQGSHQVIRGKLATEAGDVTEFSGWLGLAQALDSFLDLSLTNVPDEAHVDGC